MRTSLFSFLPLPGLLLNLNLSAQDNTHLPKVVARFYINNGKDLIDREDFLKVHGEFDAPLGMAHSRAHKAESLAWLAQPSLTLGDDPAGALRQ